MRLAFNLTLIFIMIIENFTNCSSNDVTEVALAQSKPANMNIRNKNNFSKSKSNDLLQNLITVGANFSMWKLFVGFLKPYFINKNIVPHWIPEKCRNGLNEFLSSLLDSQWAWHMVDSYGKLPAGIARGNYVWLGNYQQCVDIKVFHDSGANSVQNLKFVGEYCLLKITPQQATHPVFGGANLVGFSYGICLPNTCSLEDKKLIFTNLNWSVKINVHEAFCQTAAGKLWDNVTVLLTIILLIPVTLVFICSLFTRILIAKNSFKSKEVVKNMESKWSVWCQIFSLHHSYASLMDTSGDNISCLYGIRFLLMLIVLWTHVFSLRLAENPYTNALDVLEVLDGPFAQVTSQSFLTINMFFHLSGFCLVYAAVTGERHRRNSFSVIRCYLNRYVRITSVYFYVSMLMAGPFYFLIKGPMWGSFKVVQDACRAHWLRRLLNVENIFHTYYPDVDCVTGEYYLGTDWELHLLAVPVVYFLLRKSKSTLFFIVFSICATLLMVAYLLVGIENTSIYYSMPNNSSKGRHDNHWTYSIFKLFWSRIPSFGVGMLTAYYLAKRVEKTTKISRVTYLSGWLLFCVSVFLYNLFGDLYHRAVVVPALAKVCYLIYSSILWPCAMSWIIIHCVHFNSGYVNRFLSMRPFLILGKLGLGMYLVQSAFMYHYYNSVYQLRPVSYRGKVYDFVVLTIYCVAVSVLLYLTVESPVERILRIIRKKTNETVNKKPGNVV